MRITILTTGSLGDVLPYIALSIGLQKAGHEVCLATHTAFEPTILKRGVGFSPLPGNSHEFLASDEGQALIYGKGTWKTRRNLLKKAVELARQTLTPCLDACRDAEAIIYTPLTPVGYHIAEALHLPAFKAHYLPATRSPEFPSMLFPLPLPSIPGLWNKMTHALAEELFWQGYRSTVNSWIQDHLHLPSLPLRSQELQRYRQRLPCLYGYSSHVLPRPRSWGEWIHVTGYWFLDHPADWVPPAHLLKFLGAGPPPIFVGFGSMQPANAEEIARETIQALSQTRQRGILLLPQAKTLHIDLPESILSIESVPFDWLFPRVAGAVYHGGTGTTALALRSGIPSIIVPATADQRFWAQRVFQLGAGTRPLSHKHFSAEKLACSIDTMINDQTMRAHAQTLAQRIGAEDGVTSAVNAFNAHIAI